MSVRVRTGEVNLDALADAIALAADAGLPVVLRRDRPLEPHAQRLMDTLGVTVEVQPVSSTVLSGRGMGHYIEPGPTFAPSDGPRADWIDYRASIASVHRREQNGDTALTCQGCGTETDVTDVVHSPKCDVITGGKPKKAADWTQQTVIAALQAYAAGHDGQGPSSVEWMQASEEHPTYAIVVRLFGSWNEGIVAAGLEARRGGRRARRTVDADEREAAAAELRDLHARRELDEEIESSEGQGAHPRPDPPADASATSEATLPGPEIGDRQNLPPVNRAGSPKRTWTRETIIEAIQRWAHEHGAPPASTDWFKRVDDYPSTSMVKRLFDGSWADAVEAAGFPRPHRGGRKPRTDGRQNPAVVDRQEVPVVWKVKVNGTGLRYRTVDEALVAADEIEHDGERVAHEARVDGHEGKADMAIDASRELAQKIRDACNSHAETIRDDAVEPVAEPTPDPPLHADRIPDAAPPDPLERLEALDFADKIELYEYIARTAALKAQGYRQIQDGLLKLREASS